MGLTNRPHPEGDRSADRSDWYCHRAVSQAPVDDSAERKVVSPRPARTGHRGGRRCGIVRQAQVWGSTVYTYGERTGQRVEEAQQMVDYASQLWKQGPIRGVLLYTWICGRIARVHVLIEKVDGSYGLFVASMVRQVACPYSIISLPRCCHTLFTGRVSCATLF